MLRKRGLICPCTIIIRPRKEIISALWWMHPAYLRILSIRNCRLWCDAGNISALQRKWWFPLMNMAVIRKPPEADNGGKIRRGWPQYVSGISTHISRPFRYNDPDRPEAAEPGCYLNSLALTSVLMTLVRHADRVKIGCMTCGLFVIGHDEEHVWKQARPPYVWAFIKYASGVSLRPAVEAPVYSVEGYNLNRLQSDTGLWNVPYIEACASFDEKKGSAIFLINRSWKRNWR